MRTPGKRLKTQCARTGKQIKDISTCYGAYRLQPRKDSFFSAVSCRAGSFPVLRDLDLGPLEPASNNAHALIIPFAINNITDMYSGTSDNQTQYPLQPVKQDPGIRRGRP